MRVRAFLLVAVVAGLALLAAGCGGGGKEPAITPTPTPSAGDGGELPREEIIRRAVRIAALPDNRPDPSKVTATRMTECEALEIMRWEGVPWGRSPNPPSESPVWLVEVRGEFSGFIGFGLTPDPSPPRVGKFIQILEVDGSVGAATILSDERAQEGPELSREKIIERALLEVEIPGNHDDPSTATSTRTTYREAVDTLRREGAPQDFSERPGPDRPVWLFEVSGEFVDLCSGAARPGRAFLVLALDGFVESGGLIPDAAPTP